MIPGYIKKYIPMFMKLTEEPVGILNGIEVSLVSLQNINKVNITIGIVIVGINLINEKIKTIQIMVRLESYL